MFQLKCFIDGETHQELKITSGDEIVIGRDDSCDVKLESFPGISRQHLKIVHLGDKLLVERLSQAGKLVVNGLSEKSIEVIGQGHFSIPPYNFEVLQEIEDIEIQSLENEEDDNDQVNEFQPEETYAGNFEKTSLSTQDLVATFKKIEFGSVVDELKMDAHKWTFGRAKTCDVFIDHDKSSRQHFEVYKLNDKFLIKDLGSSNGTFLNGHQLPANNEIELKSGDIISIHDYKLLFEIKDSIVEKQIYNLPENYKPIDMGHLANGPITNSGMGVKKVKDGWVNLNEWSPQKKVRVGITAGFILLAALFAFMPAGTSNKSAAQREIAALRQRAEENKIIDNAKVAAIQYIGEARWSLCLSEVQRIQDLRPDDQDAAEIGVKCQTALEMLERQSQMEAQERDRLAIIEKVSAIIESCKDKVTEGSDVIKLCLQPAIELSPENEEIAKLFDQADAVDRKNDEIRLRQQKYADRLNRGRALIRKGDKFKEQQYWEDALKWYGMYLKGKYPDPKGNDRVKASREIASIKSALESTLKKALDESKLQFAKENYREAVLAARKGLKIDEFDAQLVKIESEARGLLRIEIRSLYQDSILMEDLGKIHTAISKWKQIVERDIPEEEYFQKAESKLKSYETEI